MTHLELLLGLFGESCPDNPRTERLDFCDIRHATSRYGGESLRIPSEMKCETNFPEKIGKILPCMSDSSIRDILYVRYY